MDNHKWHMHRMGLVDFWYYVNEEFEFANGHMLLRGSNGSGKSVTMQSFIPLLLDGNKSSERLDAFGSRSRKLETYLLDDGTNRDDRIAYLYLEFKKEDAKLYKTIGMGLHARRNKPLQSWYFVIEDNRRINKDIFLMEHNLAITKQMLKNSIGEQLIETQTEYMERVNQAIFGFPSKDQYKEMIQLLIQVRSPKLSNSLKPTMINELLRDSLQPLSEEDLRPMSEAISSMDQIKDQLDTLKASSKAAKEIFKVYDDYNRVVLFQKCKLYYEQMKHLEAFAKENEALHQKIVEKKQTWEQVKLEHEALKKEYTLCLEEQKNLAKDNVLELAQSLQEDQEEAQRIQRVCTQKTVQHEEKENQAMDCKKRLDQAMNQQDMMMYELKELLTSMQELQDLIHFDEFDSMQQAILEHPSSAYSETTTMLELKKCKQEITEGIQAFTKYEQYKVQEEQCLEEEERYVSNKQACYDALHRLQHQLAQVKDELCEEVDEWNEENEYLTLDAKQLQEVIASIQNSEQHELTCTQAKQYVDTLYLSKIEENYAMRATCVQEHKQQVQHCNELQQKIHTLQQQKQIQPDLEEYAIQARAYLKSAHIPFVPLYEKLEFSEDVSSKQRNVFEEMLTRMNLLHALIVHSSYQQHITSMDPHYSEYFLFSEQEVDDLSLFYISKQFIEQCNFDDLFAFFQIPSLPIQLEENYYRMGGLLVTYSQQEEAKYIGEGARARYRQQQMELLQTQLQKEQEHRNKLELQLQRIDQIQEILQQEYKNFPSMDAIYDVVNRMEQKDQELVSIQEQIKRVNQRKQKIVSYVLQEKEQYNRIATQLQIYPKKSTFEQYREDLETYRELFLQLMSKQQRYISMYELVHTYKLQLEQLQQDFDFLAVELQQYQEKLTLLSALIQQKELQLRGMGYEEIKQRMQQLQQRIQQLPLELSNKDREDIRLYTELEHDQKEYEHSKQQYNQQSELLTRYKQCYIQEVSLHYVFDEEVDLEDIRFVYSKLSQMSLPLKSKEDIAVVLQKIFYENIGALREYNPSIKNLFEEDEHSKRLDIYAKRAGVQISFIHLLIVLEESIEQQKLLLQESERELIEDILVNTISKKIRFHIQNSKRWVERMNRYMDEMNNSNGLKLNLQWKSKKAENEQELSSQQLVELLEKDIRLLKESDMNKLSSHFRSKISIARKLVEQEDCHESFHQIMKEVMDYRKWYDFTILSQKAGEKKKELTNNSFFQFSGGEKALSMYIPLFSAVAAKFEGARADAPWLIALDEAFAGVDEKNISNMFDLIGKFNFDYIMNSQILWGDYPGVSTLHIYELIRPENAHYVTKIAYEWNGLKKSLKTS